MNIKKIASSLNRLLLKIAAINNDMESVARRVSLLLNTMSSKKEETFRVIPKSTTLLVVDNNTVVSSLSLEAKNNKVSVIDNKKAVISLRLDDLDRLSRNIYDYIIQRIMMIS